MKQFFFKKTYLFLSVILFAGCESKPVNIIEQTANPYTQHGVEGHMGMTMASCLATPPQAPPIRRSKKGPLIGSDNYFDCVEREILKKEVRDNENKKITD
jgi:hypothetical protein